MIASSHLFNSQFEVQARVFIERGCQYGEGDSCGVMASYLFMDGAHDDAWRMYEQACQDMSSRMSCGMFGSALIEADEVERGEGLLRDACAEGEVWSCAQLGRHLVQGDVAPKFGEVGLDYLLRGCEGGATHVCHEAAALSVQAGDPASAVVPSMRLCDAGRESACLWLVSYYQSGVGGWPDIERAAEFLEKACEFGDASSCSNLGWWIESGHVWDREFKDMLELYRKGCEGGSDQGCVNLAGWYTKGSEELPRDLGRAADILEDACERRLAQSCNNYGLAVTRGEGRPRSIEESTLLYQRSCELGAGIGCANLGKRYLSGEGVGVDRDRALELWRMACHLDYSEACDWVEQQALLEAEALDVASLCASVPQMDEEHWEACERVLGYERKRHLEDWPSIARCIKASDWSEEAFKTCLSGSP